ncbi:MAG: hypothetical protein E6Q97_12650 [Desulfurellales bacterium]|nr:MAG: hypothetical protein E6Q97_12650 [Desulfurellales bacterium]
MTEAKHTPGPWEILGPGKPTSDAPEGGDFAITDSNKDIIAETFFRVSAVKSRPSEANARLIAAAPELLEALYWYEGMAKEMGKAAIRMDQKRILELMREIAVDYGKKASSAIAKATKGQL